MDEDAIGHLAGKAAGKIKRPRTWPAMVFIVSLALPFLFQVGPIQLMVYRIILLVALVPCLVMWSRGQAGPIRIADIALFSMCLWVGLSFFVIHGPAKALEAGGIFFVETMGAYLVARCFIRDADSFHRLVRLLFWIMLFMLPFAVYETITGDNILLRLANRIFDVGENVPKEPRWGFDRVQGVFDHPILFGIFCGSIPALVFYVLGYRTSAPIRWGKSALATFVALLSLSSGPLTSLIVQIAMITWDRLLSSVRHRWFILSGSVLSMVVAIEIAANRSTPEILISYFAFDPWTALNRLRIWQYGTLTVEKYPFFGVGENDWIRPEWMGASMDMFWLFPAVRHGLPAALLIHLAFFLLFILIATKSDLPERIARYRTGYLICMMGFYLGGWTVHYWRTIYVLFIFLLGSGVWILESNKVQSSSKHNDPTSPHDLKPLKPVLRRKSKVIKYTRTKSNPTKRRD